MTKKIQNSSQSSAVTKVKKVAEPVLDGVVTVSEVEVVVPTTVVVPSDSFEDDISLGGGEVWQKKNAFAESVDVITDKPIANINGKEVELVKSTGPKSIQSDHPVGRFGDHKLISNSLATVGTGISSPRFNDAEIAKFNLEWWETKIAGITIYMTPGSQLNVIDSISSNDWDYEESLSTEPTLTLIGSSLTTSSLVASGDSVLNNSALTCDAHLTIKSSKITVASINVTGYVEITKSKITGMRIWGVKSLNLRNCKLYSMGFNGLTSVELKDVNTRGDKFNLSVSAREKGNLSFSSRNSTLFNYDGSFYNISDEAIAHKTTPSSTYSGRQETELNVKSRLDYGHFSGKHQIPFIRFGQCDILVGGEVFKASEFNPLPPKEVYPVPQEPVEPARAWYPGAPRYDMPSVLNTGNYYRGSMLWNRAAKVIFGWNYGSTPISASGESLVNALVEQIKSRINLYVEISNLSE